MNMILKFFTFTIFTSVFLIGLSYESQDNTTQVNLNNALQAVVDNKCWKKSDLNGLSFSETDTRRAQSPTKDTCVVSWSDVQTLWKQNNELVNLFNESFQRAMQLCEICNDKKENAKTNRRKLQRKTIPECRQSGGILENESWEQLRRLLADPDVAESFVNQADAVNLTHTDPTLPGDNAADIAETGMDNMKILTGECQGKNKFMHLPGTTALHTTRQADHKCQQALETLWGTRALRVAQVNNLLTTAVQANCSNTQRRLKRMMRMKYQNRTLQVMHPKMCDTAEKAVKLALGNLSASPHWW